MATEPRSSIPPASSSPSPHREVISRVLTSYYKLLTRFPYLPETSIQYPPPAGWNLDTASRLQRVGRKSAAVIDVLNHIPYLTTTTFEVNYETSVIDWREDRVRNAVASEEESDILGGLRSSATEIPRLQQASLEPMLQTLPENIVSLTQASNYGRWLLLDVDTGLVTNYSVLGGPDPKCTDEEREANIAWKKHETKSIIDLFEEWSDNLRALWWVPLPASDGTRGTIRTPASANDTEQEEIRTIYLNHGWDDQSRDLPHDTLAGESAARLSGEYGDNVERESNIQGNGFRKEDCRAALLDWQEAHSRKRLAEYDDSRAAKAARRRARLAATEIAATDHPSGSSQGATTGGEGRG